MSSLSPPQKTTQGFSFPAKEIWAVFTVIRWNFSSPTPVCGLLCAFCNTTALFCWEREGDVPTESSPWNFLISTLFMLSISDDGQTSHPERRGSLGQACDLLPRFPLVILAFPTFSIHYSNLVSNPLSLCMPGNAFSVGQGVRELFKEKPSHFHTDAAHFPLKCFHHPLWDFTFSL